MKIFKKFAVTLLAVVMLVCSFVTTAFAVIPAGVNRNTTLEVEGVGLVCFIENEFYSLFYDDYLEDYYNEYCEYYDIWVSDNTGIYDTAEMYLSSDGISKGSSVHVNYILENEGSHYVTLFFVCNEGGKYFSAEENGMIAKSLPDGAEVVFVGNTTPCVVVRIEGKTSTILEIIENPDVAFVSMAFNFYGNRSSSPAIFEDTFTPTAADARKILRYSAGLDKAPENRSEAKRFFFMSDSDFDGKLTASDARTALRIAAGLEKGYTFRSNGNYSFWDE